MKAALYLRVSTLDQTTLNQKLELEGHCKNQGIVEHKLVFTEIRKYLRVEYRHLSKRGINQFMKTETKLVSLSEALVYCLSIYTKRISREEFGLKIQVRHNFFRSRIDRGKFARCYWNSTPKRICYNKNFLRFTEIEFVKIDWWDIMLHEIAHINRDKLLGKIKRLKENEYLDSHHDLHFWSFKRQLGKKYKKYREDFIKQTTPHKFIIKSNGGEQWTQQNNQML